MTKSRKPVRPALQLLTTTQLATTVGGLEVGFKNNASTHASSSWADQK